MVEEISCNQLNTSPYSLNPKGARRFHHEYEKIVPKLKLEEYQELKSSIAENGLYHPIIINKDGFILDGHHKHGTSSRNTNRTTTRSKNKMRLNVLTVNIARKSLLLILT